jgi:hypothetical protein
LQSDVKIPTQEQVHAKLVAQKELQFRAAIDDIAKKIKSLEMVAEAAVQQQQQQQQQGLGGGRDERCMSTARPCRRRWILNASVTDELERVSTFCSCIPQFEFSISGCVMRCDNSLCIATLLKKFQKNQALCRLEPPITQHTLMHSS